MNALKLLALVLIVGGILGLVYGGITYTQTSHEASLGPLDLSVKKKKTVSIPVWAGIGAIVAGGALLTLRPK